jgi:hypothetical protein
MATNRATAPETTSSHVWPRGRWKGTSMDPSLMLRTSAVLFAIAAVGGLVMAAIRFGGKPTPPSWLAMLHGLLAGAGLTLLAYAYCTATVPALAAWALLLFLIAGAGGVALNLGFHLKAMALPIWLVVVHAAIAVVGFVLLAIAAWGGRA